MPRSSAPVSDFHAKCMDTAIISGHLMCAAADVIPLSCLATANLADTTYFSGDKWRAATLRTLRNWCKHWKLPLQVSAQLPRWVDRQREIHQQTVQASSHKTWDPKAVAQAVRPLRALVLGPADHFPNSLFIACPVYYHQLLCKTFGDPAVFPALQERYSQDCSTFTTGLREPTSRIAGICLDFSMEQRTAECQDPTKRIQTVQ